MTSGAFQRCRATSGRPRSATRGASRTKRGALEQHPKTRQEGVSVRLSDILPIQGESGTAIRAAPAPGRISTAPTYRCPDPPMITMDFRPLPISRSTPRSTLVGAEGLMDASLVRSSLSRFRWHSQKNSLRQIGSSRPKLGRRAGYDGAFGCRPAHAHARRGPNASRDQQPISARQETRRQTPSPETTRSGPALPGNQRSFLQVDLPR